MANDESRVLEHQFPAQTPGSPVCVARGKQTGHRLLAGNEMSGRTISGARLASSWVSLGLSRREIVQWRRDSFEK